MSKIETPETPKMTLLKNGVQQMMDLTPTWAAVVPIILMAFENGTEKGRQYAIDELKRMAELLDRQIARHKQATAAGLPPRMTEGHPLELIPGTSETVIVKVKGFKNLAMGRYLHELGEWQVDHFSGHNWEVEEWWSMPEAGTGHKPGEGIAATSDGENSSEAGLLEALEKVASVLTTAGLLPVPPEFTTGERP